MANLAPKLNFQWPGAAARCITALTPRGGALAVGCCSSCDVRAQRLRDTQATVHAVTRNNVSQRGFAQPSRHRPRVLEPARLDFPKQLTSRSYSTAQTKEPVIESIFEPVTGTWQYIIADPRTLQVAIVDPVLDYDPSTRSITTATADSLLDLIAQKKYTVTWILETHAHADHLTAASYLQKRLSSSQPKPPTMGIGSRIHQIQSIFGKRPALLRLSAHRLRPPLLRRRSLLHLSFPLRHRFPSPRPHPGPHGLPSWP